MNKRRDAKMVREICPPLTALSDDDAGCVAGGVVVDRVGVDRQRIGSGCNRYVAVGKDGRVPGWFHDVDKAKAAAVQAGGSDHVITLAQAHELGSVDWNVISGS